MLFTAQMGYWDARIDAPNADGGTTKQKLTRGQTLKSKGGKPHYTPITTGITYLLDYLGDLGWTSHGMDSEIPILYSELDSYLTPTTGG
jgi:hypothetical protein